MRPSTASSLVAHRRSRRRAPSALRTRYPERRRRVPAAATGAGASWSPASRSDRRAAAAAGRVQAAPAPRPERSASGDGAGSRASALSGVGLIAVDGVGQRVGRGDGAGSAWSSSAERRDRRVLRFDDAVGGVCRHRRIRTSPRGCPFRQCHAGTRSPGRASARTRASLEPTGDSRVAWRRDSAQVRRRRGGSPRAR